jgi:hypothetical protein
VVVVSSCVVTPLALPVVAVGSSPDTPANVTPPDGAAGVSLAPALQSSAFSDPNTRHSHAASHWQIRASSGDYSSPVFDSGSDTSHLTSMLLPSEMLDYSATYYWHVRYQDNRKAWSSWSTETRFTTLSSTGDTIPPAVTTSGVSGSGTSSATLNGILSSLGTGSSVQVSFEWGLTTSYGHITTPEAKSATGMFSANLTGLSVGTVYHFRAKAVGDVAPVHGNDVSFTTDSICAPVVTTDAATIMTTTSATVNGALAALGTAGSVNVSFQWGKTTAYGNETSAQAMSAIGIFSANLNGLSANTEYHFRAKAVGDDAAVYGEDTTFATADATAPAISAVNSSNIAAIGATINWTTDELATTQVEYGLTTEYGRTTILDRNLTTTHTVRLTSLSANSTYHYRAMSKDPAGNEAVSEDLTFTTVGSSDGGMPAWALAVIVLVGVGGAGGVAYFISKRLAQKQSPISIGT